MNVLVIAYQFPPCGGGGVQRITKFVKYLSRLDCAITVITARENDYTQIDGSLLGDIPERVRIIRVPDNAVISTILGGFKKHPKSRFLSLFTRVWNRGVKPFRDLVLVPDTQVLWSRKAARVVCGMASSRDFDVVMSTSSPYSAHMAAVVISKRLHIPMVADFRDPWVRNHHVAPSPIVLNRHRQLERRVVETARCVTVVSPPMINLFLKDYPHVQDSTMFQCITNGYDEEDFSVYKCSRSTMFELVYVGSLYGSRTATTLIQGILKAREQLQSSRMVLRIIGNKTRTTNRELEEAINKGLICESEAYISHADVISRYSNASLLLLVLSKQPGSHLDYSGKIFEYIRTQKPILALAGEGVAAQLIRETRTGVVVDPDDIAGISNAIVKEYRRWEQGEVFSSNTELISSYNRESQSKELYRIITSICDKNKSQSG